MIECSPLGRSVVCGRYPIVVGGFYLDPLLEDSLRFVFFRLPAFDALLPHGLVVDVRLIVLFDILFECLFKNF